MSVQKVEHLDNIKKFIKNNVTVVSSIKEDSNKIRTQRSLQHLFSKVFSNKDEQMLYMIVLEHVANSEKNCPGAGVKILEKFCQLDAEEKGIEQTIKTKNDLCEKIENLQLSKRSQSLLLEVLDLCNKGTKIKVKKSSSQKTFIEVLNSHYFKSQILLKHKRNTQEKDTKVLVIDGYIESVSELHHIFQHFSVNEPDRAFAIFCRGMSDDVLNTISVNNLRGSLNCYPIKVDFDLEGINTLVDVAVVCDSDVVSSTKGNLISSIKVSDLKTVKQFSVVSDGVLIKNDESYLRVETHIKQLQKKCEETQVDDVKDLILKRIESLSSNCIEIAIPDDINFYSTSKELDEGIRIISFVINGIYKVNETVELFHTKLTKRLSDTVLVNLY